MANLGPKRKSKREHELDVQLGLIIDEMCVAMWDADRPHMAVYQHMTQHMRDVLAEFYEWCRENYGQKA